MKSQGVRFRRRAGAPAAPQRERIPEGYRRARPPARAAHPCGESSTRKALELSFREALRLGHNYVGTEHILLALVELEDGGGVLSGLGIDKPGAAEYVTATLAALP